MRYYRDTSRPLSDGYEISASGGWLRETPGYYELVMPLTDGEFGTCYLVVRDQWSVWVCTCLQDMFTGMVRTFMAQNEVIRPSLMKGMREAWPVVYELLDNGMNEQYAPAALTLLEDPDDASGKWVVTTVVGNLPSLERSDVFDHRTRDAVLRVFDLTDRAVREFRMYSIDRLTLAGRVFGASVSADMKSYTRFAAQHFDTILELLA